jgi:hypothetical protein
MKIALGILVVLAGTVLLVDGFASIALRPDNPPRTDDVHQTSEAVPSKLTVSSTEDGAMIVPKRRGGVVYSNIVRVWRDEKTGKLCSEQMDHINIKPAVSK